MEYKDDHVAFIREVAGECGSYEELAWRFNERFGTRQTANAMNLYTVNRLGLKIASKKNAMHFTEDEIDWLRQNYEGAEEFTDLTERLNAVFGRGRKASAVRELCSKRLGLKGMKNLTQFGNVTYKEQLPVGTIRATSNKVTYIKVRLMDGPQYCSGYEEPYWMPIQKKVWQDHYGEVPEGKMVIFLDGNHENLEIENLYCIDRRISALLATNRWYTNSREHTLTAIKWCEFYFARKDRRELASAN